MGTVVGELQIDVSSTDNVTPLVDPQVTLFGAGDVRVRDNMLRCWTAGGGGFYSAIAPTSDIVTVKVEIGGEAGDNWGPAFVDTNGDGYYLRIRHDEIQLFALSNGAQSGVVLSFAYRASNYDPAVPLNISDEVVVTRNNVTGAMELFLKGVSTWTNTRDPGTVLRAGYFYLIADWAQTGATSWAADGYAAVGPRISVADITDGESSITYSPLDFSGPITSVEVDGSPAASFTQTTFNNKDISAVATHDGVSAPRVGELIDVVVSDGTDTAEAEITVLPKAGWTRTKITVPDESTEDSLFQLMAALDDPITLATDNLFYMDTTDGSEITETGLYNLAIPKTFYYYNSAAQLWYLMTMVRDGGLVLIATPITNNRLIAIGISKSIASGI